MPHRVQQSKVAASRFQCGASGERKTTEALARLHSARSFNHSHCFTAEGWGSSLTPLGLRSSRAFPGFARFPYRSRESCPQTLWHRFQGSADNHQAAQGNDCKTKAIGVFSPRPQVRRHLFRNTFTVDNLSTVTCFRLRRWTICPPYPKGNTNYGKINQNQCSRIRFQTIGAIRFLSSLGTCTAQAIGLQPLTTRQ